MPSVLCIAIQITAALIFGHAAFAKLRDLERFRRILSAYQLLPDRWVRAVALLVPTLEGAIAVAWVVRVWEHAATFAAAGLLMLFGVAIAVNLVRGRTSLRCGCTWSGGAADQIAPWMVIRNFAIAMVLLASLDAEPTRLGGLDAFAIGCAAVALALLYHAVPGLLLQQRARKVAGE